MHATRAAARIPALCLGLGLAVGTACGGEAPSGVPVARTRADVGAGPGEDAAGTRFAVMGHLYPIAGDRARLRHFLERVDATNPDLVFVLGDSALGDPAVVALFRESLSAPLHATPGNHELKRGHREAYLESFPHLAQTVVAPDCNFVLVTSSMPLDDLRATVAEALAELEPGRPTVLLTHHRIWDDTLTSPGPYQHDKSYWFGEIHPVLEGRVDAIFAGNSKRQYFRDLSTGPNYGPQNVNNVYWADRVGDITAYSVGMGDGVPKAGFVVAEVVGGRLLLEAHAVVWDGEDPVDRSLIQPVRRSRPPRR